MGKLTLQMVRLQRRNRDISGKELQYRDLQCRKRKGISDNQNRNNFNGRINRHNAQWREPKTMDAERWSETAVHAQDRGWRAGYDVEQLAMLNALTI